MFRGSPCPNCNESILSFREFIKITDTNKTFNCENCGKKVKLNNSLMIFIITAVIIGLAIPTFLVGTGNVPELFNNLTTTTGILSVILYVVLWFVAVSYLGWRFIGWKEVVSSNH